MVNPSQPSIPQPLHTLNPPHPALTAGQPLTEPCGQGGHFWLLLRHRHHAVAGHTTCGPRGELSHLTAHFAPRLCPVRRVAEQHDAGQPGLQLCGVCTVPCH